MIGMMHAWLIFERIIELILLFVEFYNYDDDDFLRANLQRKDNARNKNLKLKS